MPSPHPTRSTGSISLTSDENLLFYMAEVFKVLMMNMRTMIIHRHLYHCKDSNKCDSDEKFDSDFLICVTFLKPLLSLQLEIAEEWTMNTSVRWVTSIPALAETTWTTSVRRNSSSWPHLARNWLVVLEQVGLRVRRDACTKASL